MDISSYMHTLGEHARLASRTLAAASTGQKNAALHAIARAIENGRASLLAANTKDLEAGQHLDGAMRDRLTLNDIRIQGMADGIRQVAELPDPIGAINQLNYRPSGIQVGRMRVPLGVIGIIYESRPNVTADAAALCLKSGNAAILRGGSEAVHSNRAIATCIQKGLEEVGLPRTAVQVVETTDREAVGHLVRAKEHVDVIVPRGGKGLIELVSREATVPVIKHLDGICHVYIDDRADWDKAIRIAINAKTHRYGVCNAMETLLIARDAVAQVLPELDRRYRELGVELRGCAETCGQLSDIGAASEADWDTEYLAPILSIRIVDGLEQAIKHINTHSSQHTDAIITEDFSRARRFLSAVDSSSVMVNASTRFADGFEYGLGAEIGISTDKIHARGPVGLEGLTSEKYIVLGDGHIRE